jgi:hypothetical protein
LVQQTGDSYPGHGLIYFWNNTVFSQYSGSGTTAIACRFANIDSDRIAEIKNNICYSPSGYQYPLYIDNGVDTPGNVDYNGIYTDGKYFGYAKGSKTWSQWQSSGYDLNGINQNPSLDSKFSPDDSSDPEVDAGTAIADFNTDINGFTRPEGIAWDIGAYEFNGSISENPNPPTNLRIIN